MAKYRSITEKAYILGYRAARIERQSYFNDYWKHYHRWQRTRYGKAFSAARRHLWQRIDHEYHSAWWTPAQLRYRLWCERKGDNAAMVPF